MADVDNYLRELPADRTPRARMAERYVSLLRYLCLWREDGSKPDSGYDAIVIVAHSQGTVITADLLRYLEYFQAGTRAFEPHLARLSGAEPRLPIVLLTMGCPLRQLYGQRFPDIYRWVGGASDPATNAPAQPDVSSLLGVSAWINLYRSGDYVGRSVWRGRDTISDMYAPKIGWTEASAHRAEACIGPGAHTHYWDETADVVSLAIDAVVRGVTSGNPASILIDQAMQVVTNSSSVAIQSSTWSPQPAILPVALRHPD
jgi:hypothetical protein